jgi:hypothetical protein
LIHLFYDFIINSFCILLTLFVFFVLILLFYYLIVCFILFFIKFITFYVNIINRVKISENMDDETQIRLISSINFYYSQIKNIKINIKNLKKILKKKKK